MVFAVILLFCSVAVALQFMVSPLYADLGQAVLVVWYYLDMLMAVSLLVALAVQLQRKRAADRGRGDGLSRERLEANTMFYLSVIVTLLFFRNWFDLLTSSPLGNQSVSALVVWEIVDPLIVIVVGLTGCHLWRNSAPSAGYLNAGRT